MHYPHRIEEDFLGEKAIPESALYGIQTARAMENFNITGIPISSEPLIIEAFAEVKKAAAIANFKCGVLSKEKAEAISFACDKLIGGNYHEHFPTDMIQGGAGTSCNMNANEVIANLGLEIMGKEKGQYHFLHPNNDVNCSQSTNDAYPTAFRLALYNKINQYLLVLEKLQLAFDAKGNEFRTVIKMGRTQLQDAVPMTLGQEFKGFATTIREDIQRLKEAQQLILEINMGATAIGTRINAPDGYPEICVEELKIQTGIPFSLSEDLIEATSDTGAYVQISGTLKRSAIKISKICNDLRLLSSGPRAGFNEINLPKLQPGSSIMPGKVNPVIPEMVNQTAYYVIGADVTISMAAEAGQLQLNVMEPVIAFSLLSSFAYMTKAVNTLVDKCIVGITANEEVCKQMVLNSIGIITALNPVLGYEACSKIAKEALATGKSIYDIAVIEKKLVSEEKWQEIFNLENLINPKFIQ